MVYQHESGVPIRVETIAGEDLPFYRFIEINPDKKFVLATGKNPLLGVTIPEIDAYVRMKDGTVKKRDNSYFKGEIPRILRSGVCYVKVEGEIGIGDHITLDKNGMGKKYIPPKELTIGEDTSSTGKNKGTKADAEGESSDLGYESFIDIRGMVLDTKNGEDVVRVDLHIV